MRKSRHKKALLAALAALIICGLPVGYLAYLYRTDVIKQVGAGPYVSEFNYVSVDGKKAFSHFDMIKRVSLILNIPTECSASCQTGLELFKDVKVWADQHLRNPNPYDSKPQHMNFAIFSRGRLPIDAIEGVIIFELEAEEDFITPEDLPVEEVTFAIADQDSRFAAWFKLTDPDIELKLKRVLARETSRTYLYHYLSVQALMWKKAREYARGQID